MTKASGRLTLTAVFNNATYHYTFTADNPFRFKFPSGNNLARELGFDPAITQVIKKAQCKLQQSCLSFSSNNS